MKILVVTQWYPHHGSEYLGLFVQEQVKALMESGHEIQVFFPYDPGVKELELNVNDGVFVWRLNLIRNYILNAFAFLVAAMKIRRNFKFDIIHSHETFWAGVYAGLFAKIIRRPIVNTEHYSKFTEQLNRHGFLKRMIIKALNSNIIVMSSAFSKVVSDNLKIPISNLHIIPNLIDESNFKIEVNTKNFEKYIYKILFVGLTDFEFDGKGLKVLIQALKLLSENFEAKAIGVLDIGKYEQYALQNKITNIKFLPPLSHKIVCEEISNCDIFVLPSYNETFGCVLVEALMAGKPVISTKCGGPEDIIRPFGGELINCGDPKQLAFAINRIANNILDFNPRLLHNDAVERFGKRAIVQQLEKYYKEVINRYNK